MDEGTKVELAVGTGGEGILKSQGDYEKGTRGLDVQGVWHLLCSHGEQWGSVGLNF